MRVIRVAILSLSCVLLVLLGPLAGAQGSLRDEQAEAAINLRAIGDGLVFAPRDPLAGETGDPDSAQCRGEPFLPRASGFDFHSGSSEWACGVAIWKLQLPEETGLFELSFKADREITSQEGGTSHALQELVIRDNEGQVLSEVELFPRDAADAPLEEFNVRIALTQETTTLDVEWHLQDDGTVFENGLPSLPMGSTFDSRVESIQARLTEIPVPDLRTLEPVETLGPEEALRSKDTQFILPAFWFNQSADTQVEIQLHVRGAFHPRMLILPGGHEVSTGELRQTPNASSKQDGEQTQSVFIPSSMTQAGGPGLYTMRFTTTSPLPTFLPGGPLAGLGILMIPFLLAGFAGRVLYDRRDEKGPMNRFWRFSPLAAAGSALLLGAWLQGKGGLAVLTRSHTASEIVWLFPLLSALSVASLLILVFGHGVRFRDRRRDWHATQEALRQERLEREEAETALYAVAHDLKSPLVALDHLVNAQGTGEAESHRRARSVIREMDDVVSDVLVYAQNVGAARQSGSTWVRPVVQQVVDSLTDHDGGDNVSMIVEPGPDACVESNAQSLHRVLHNLVGNAVKYGPDNGAVVRVSLRLTEKGGKRSFMLEVADNGRGIAKEDHERAFALLTRLPDRQGRTLPGTGVGLAAVKRILETQGATIEIDNAPEGGALLRVTWPHERIRKWRMGDKPSVLPVIKARMHPSSSRLSEPRSVAGAGSA